MEEYLDVLDETGNRTGEVLPKSEIHSKGKLHGEVGIWIVNKKYGVLMQKRSTNKKSNPNKWATTTGHIDAGEEAIDAVLREVKEELGVDLDKKDIKLMYANAYNIPESRKDMINYVYGYEYLTFVDFEENEYKIQQEELSEVKYVPYSELKSKILKFDENILIPRENGWVDTLFSHLDKYLID